MRFGVCMPIEQAEFIANPVGRVPMTPQDTADYKAFFHALHFIGYNARMSLECPVKNPETQLPVVLEVFLEIVQHGKSGGNNGNGSGDAADNGEHLVQTLHDKPSFPVRQHSERDRTLSHFGRF